MTMTMKQARRIHKARFFPKKAFETEGTDSEGEPMIFITKRRERAADYMPFRQWARQAIDGADTDSTKLDRICSMKGNR